MKWPIIIGGILGLGSLMIWVDPVIGSVSLGVIAVLVVILALINQPCGPTYGDGG
jgi:hypothetical protein